MSGARYAVALSIVGAAGLFGVIDAEIWGNQSDLVFWIGNVSSTYLLVAFLAGRTWFRVDRRLVLAAVAGMVVIPVALAAFYGWAIARGELYSGTAAIVAGKYVASGLIPVRFLAS